MSDEIKDALQAIVEGCSESEVAEAANGAPGVLSPEDVPTVEACKNYIKQVNNTQLEQLLPEAAKIATMNEFQLEQKLLSFGRLLGTDFSAIKKGTAPLMIFKNVTRARNTITNATRIHRPKSFLLRKAICTMRHLICKAKMKFSIKNGKMVQVCLDNSDDDDDDDESDSELVLSETDPDDGLTFTALKEKKARAAKKKYFSLSHQSI